MSEEKSLFPAMESSVADLQTKHKRIKSFFVDDRILVEVASAIVHGKPGHQIRGLPEDVEVLGVWYEHQRKSFRFHCCSMEWPIHGGQYMVEDIEIEVVTAPTEETQFVLWKKMCDGLNAKQQVIEAPKALDVVVEGVDETLPS